MARVVALDFSEYERFWGAGVVVYSGDVYLQSFKLASASHRLGMRMGVGVAGLKLALYGIHRREHGDETAEEWVKLIVDKAVEEVVALPSPTREKLREFVEKGQIFVADRLDRREREFLDRRPHVEGKNYLVALCDVVAYYAALVAYLEKNPQDAKAASKKLRLEGVLKRAFKNKFKII